MKRSHSYLQDKVKKVDVDPNNVHDSRKIANSASKPPVMAKSNSRRAVNYKPYTLREYKDTFDKSNNFGNKHRGGLGANIGGDEWQKENEKRKRMREFASRVKNQRKLIDGSMRRTSQTQDTESREK